TERQRVVEALHESERRLSFLAGTSARLLGSAVDYATVLEQVADLFVPGLADLCAVRELDADGSVRRVAVRQTDRLDAGTLDHLDVPFHRLPRRGSVLVSD